MIPAEMQTQISQAQRALITELANGGVIITASLRGNGQILLESRGSKSKVIRWSTFNSLIKKGLVHAETSAIATIWRLTERGKELSVKNALSMAK